MKVFRISSYNYRKINADYKMFEGYSQGVEEHVNVVIDVFDLSNFLKMKAESATENRVKFDSILSKLKLNNFIAEGCDFIEISVKIPESFIVTPKFGVAEGRNIGMLSPSSHEVIRKPVGTDTFSEVFFTVRSGMSTRIDAFSGDLNFEIPSHKETYRGYKAYSYGSKPTMKSVKLALPYLLERLDAKKRIIYEFSIEDAALDVKDSHTYKNEASSNTLGDFFDFNL